MSRSELDRFRGVPKANAHYSALFASMGLDEVANTYIECRWRGEIDGRQLEIKVTNIGSYEVSSTRIEVTLPTNVVTLLALGAMVPPLRRVGMKAFGPIKEGLKCYSHDEAWGYALLGTRPAAALLERIEEQAFIEFQPGRFVWADEISQRDGAWLKAQLELLVALVKASEKLTPAEPVPDSFVRRHSGTIALGLGVLGAGCAMSLIVAAVALLRSLP